MTTLGMVALACATRPAIAQGVTACTVLTRAEMDRITGRPNPVNLPPTPAAPNEVPKGVSQCEYLGLTFSLTGSMTTQAFNATKDNQAKNGTKVQPVSGAGDEAYYWLYERRSRRFSQIGIAMRAGQYQLAIMDLAPSDSVAVINPILLALAKAAAPRLR